MDDKKQASLARIFGCDDWIDRFYRPSGAQAGLFDEPAVVTRHRTVSGADIAAFAKQRFETIFAYVSSPLPLLVNGSDFFELYCLSNIGG